MNPLEIGQQVRNARRARDWNQRQLALQASVGMQTVVRIEAGQGGVSLDNLNAVLGALGLELATRLPYGSAAPVTALHPMHVAAERVDEVVRRAVTAACEELDALFPGAKPEVNGISSNFAGLLEEHIKALLCGQHGAEQRHLTHLPKLIWQDRDFGQPFTLPEGAQGYLVELVGEDRYLEPANSYHNITTPFRPGRYCTDLFSSWSAAAEGARILLETAGNPEAPLRIIPGVFVGDEEGVAPFVEGESHPEA